MNKRIKKISLVIISVFIFIFVLILIFAWPIDSRLQGTFKSNFQETIDYNIEHGNKLFFPNNENVKALCEHSFYQFEGHKISRYFEPFTYPIKRAGTTDFDTNEGFSEQGYFLMKKVIGNKYFILTATSSSDDEPFIQRFDIEFDKSGFWLVEGNGREKFTKIK